MKKILLFLFVIPFVISAQKPEQALRKGTWYVTGQFYLKEPLHIAADSTGGYDWKIQFLKSGKLIEEGVTKESWFDANGNEIAPGYHYKNSSYTYLFKNDLLKIDYSGQACNGSATCRLAFYRIRELAGHKGYDLECISEEEFKSRK